MAFVFLLRLLLTSSCSVGQLSLSRGQARRERTVDHFVAHGDEEPTQQCGVDLQLHGNRVTIDAAEDLGQASALSIAGSAAALTCATTSLRRATAASAKNITAWSAD